MWAKHLFYIAAVVGAALLMPVHPAEAISQCTFVSTMGVNFGVYNVFNTLPADSTGSIVYTCKGVGQGGTITIDLDRGNAPVYLSRQMRKDAEALSYNLYLDAARTVIWGDGTGGTSRYGPVTPPSNTAVTVTIHGRLPARQNVSVGSYTDTITAIINF